MNFVNDRQQVGGKGPDLARHCLRNSLAVAQRDISPIRTRPIGNRSTAVEVGHKVLHVIFETGKNFDAMSTFTLRTTFMVAISQSVHVLWCQKLWLGVIIWGGNRA